jgi:hypothetical protein
MSTNLIKLQTIEQTMAGYQPVYQPIYPLFMDGKSVAYEEVVGKVDFKTATTIGDIRAKHILPKDTEMKTVSVSESSKTFKKYFLANQFQYSALQNGSNVNDVVAQVLDEHQLQMDEMFLFGEGTAANNVVNNGLYWSGDPNYTLESSVAIAKDTNGNYATDMHSRIMQTVEDADRLSGRKLIVFYGNVNPIFDSLYVNSSVPFKSALQNVLGPNYSVMKLPSVLSPASSNGWMVVNMDQIRTHYTTLPKLDDQGVNSEKKYYWFNFLMGSLMLEVIAKDGIIRQPTTLAP